MAAKVPLQAAPHSSLRFESKPSSFGVGRLGGVDRWLNSASNSSSGVETGAGRGVARNLPVVNDCIWIGLGKGQSCAKTPNWVRGKYLDLPGGRSCSSTSIARRKTIWAVDGESSHRETAEDTSSRKFSRGGTSKGFFIDQNYDYDRRGDFYMDDPHLEGGRGVNGRVRNFIPDEELEERIDVRGNAEVQRSGARSRGWTQVDDQGGRPEASGREPNEGTYNGDLDGTGYDSEPRARRKVESYGPAEELYREKSLEDDGQSLRRPSPYIGYARDSTTDQFLNASANGVVLGQELPGDDRQYVEVTREDFPVEGGLQGSYSDALANEERWQRSNRTQGESYPSNPVLDKSSLYRDTEESSLALRKGPDYDDSYNRRGSPPNELGVEDKCRSPPRRGFDDRYDFQNNGKGSIYEIAGDKEQDQFLPKRGSIDRDTISRTKSFREAEQEVSARGALYAKQIISLATAQSLGIVTQLWVDMESLKVVALEVRPSLLFGDYKNFLLNSVSKVGDVVLIHDDITVLEEQDLFNCSDLVGNDLFTEDGVYLGKVRDYNFSLGDGAVLSLEFDTLGVPLIPSTLIKTYSLTVDEVIETQEDGLLVRKGAEKRVRKLSKGLFSRTKQSPWREQRKQTPLLKSSRSSSETASETEYMGQERERVGGFVERDKYTRGYTSREQPKRGFSHSEGRRQALNESARSNRIESDQTGDLYRSSTFFSSSKDLTAEESKDYPSVKSIRKDLPVRDSPKIVNIEQTRGPGVSAPAMRPDGWDMPMSFRTSRRRVEDDS